MSYFDSSAFVKLLVEEDGSDLAAELWEQSTDVVASRIAYPEVRAALAAAWRRGAVDEVALVRLTRRWNRHWSHVRAVELDADVEQDAGRLAQLHALRGADAVHLASALAIDGALFAVWDKRLRVAATAAGLRVVPAA